MNESDPLLDIRAAARFLKVSETSLRRWTNQGRLVCFRVGGRRERRFRRSDLMACMEGPSHGPFGGVAGAIPEETRPAANSRPEQGHATHGCAFYSSEREQATQAARFLLDGLHPEVVCFLVAAPRARRSILARIEARMPSVQADIDAGRLVISEYVTCVDAQIEYWEMVFERALGGGASALRVVGDVTRAPFAAEGDFDVALEYEEQYERTLSQRFPVTTVCQYDARPLRGLDVVSVLHGHAATWDPSWRFHEPA